jgi:hypothetical protein
LENWGVGFEVVPSILGGVGALDVGVLGLNLLMRRVLGWFF